MTDKQLQNVETVRHVFSLLPFVDRWQNPHVSVPQTLVQTPADVEPREGLVVVGAERVSAEPLESLSRVFFPAVVEALLAGAFRQSRGAHLEILIGFLVDWN